MFCPNCGKEVNKDAYVCLNCGIKIKEESSVENGGSKFGWGVLGYFIPLVGLILYISWKNTKPRSAKAAGIGALIGFGINVIFTVISFILGFSTSISGLY